jgi:hypothetical protein
MKVGIFFMPRSRDICATFAPYSRHFRTTVYATFVPRSLLLLKRYSFHSTFLSWDFIFSHHGLHEICATFFIAS